MFKSCHLRSKIVLLACLGSFAVLPGRADIKWGYTEVPSVNLKFLVILDDASQKAYFQIAGPATQWFSWGYGSQQMPNTAATVFGANGAGSIRDVYMSGYTTPTLTLSQLFQNVSTCTVGGVIYYYFTYPLAPNDFQHYNFTTATNALPLVWAVGSSLGSGGSYAKHTTSGTASLAVSNPPPAKITGMSLATGAVTLSLSNLLVSVTNQVQFSTNLVSASSWVTVTNLVVQPPCGTNILTHFISINAPRTNSPQGYWRIKQ